MSATYDYRRTRTEIADAATTRNAIIEKKKAQAMAGSQAAEVEQIRVLDKPQASLSSQPSVLRNKMTKLAREKREERFRQVSGMYESIAEFFRTTDPDKICEVLRERRENNATLEKQIEDLRSECADLEIQAERLKSQIEEAEYTSAKGVGTTRLLAEGRQSLEERHSEKRKAQRELDAVAEHQKQVGAGCHHLREILAIVEHDEEEIPDSPDAALEWVLKKIHILKEALENEDQEFLILVNKQTFALQKLKEDALLEPEPLPRHQAKVPGAKRAGKDAKLDITTRVLTRNAVKMLALKAVQTQGPAKKVVTKTK
jgi:hypothetical protein